MTDPRFTDPRLSDPVLRREDRTTGSWGWIAGLAVLVLIAFLIIAGWNSNSNTASNGSSPAITGTATHQVNPPSTTGSGGSSPRPMTPMTPVAPTAPAPAPSQK